MHTRMPYVGFWKPFFSKSSRSKNMCFSNDYSEVEHEKPDSQSSGTCASHKLSASHGEKAKCERVLRLSHSNFKISSARFKTTIV